MDLLTLRMDRARTLFAGIDGPLDEALEALSLWLATYESQERPERFLATVDIMRPVLFWRALHQQWASFDRIPHKRIGARMLRHREAWRPEYMQPESLAAYEQLPETFAAYRGQSADSDAGLSWTLDRAVAERFARGHRLIPVDNPVVIEATISKASVAGVFTSREESEVVLFSARDAKKRKTAAFETLAEV